MMMMMINKQLGLYHKLCSSPFEVVTRQIRQHNVVYWKHEPRIYHYNVLMAKLFHFLIKVRFLKHTLYNSFFRFSLILRADKLYRLCLPLEIFN